MSRPGVFDGETPDGGMQGVVVGIVTDNEDPKDLGRVKLRFPWRDADDESYWARLAVPMAGTEYGTYFLPEVDDEVLVAFENGDIHNPYVVGALWNGTQRPPQKNDGANDTREIKSRSGHRLAFDDADDGTVTIETSAGHEIHIDDGKDTITLRDKSGSNEICLDGASDSISVEAAGDLDLSAKNITLEADKSVTIDAGTSVDVSSRNAVDLSAKGQLSVGSNGVMKLNATGPLSVKGAIIRLN
ncbi:phage baseplate assembly protein V [Halovivax limisalsi]|uniref:phage baseplate assembly protein V n=1 Tax=Halovivax limisalsi TaxID=1453760 RepID=UPI001FFD3A19|nr:phage baseplate assembly protein V [Halovivax limisalsi]